VGRLELADSVEDLNQVHTPIADITSHSEVAGRGLRDTYREGGPKSEAKSSSRRATKASEVRYRT